MQEEKPTKLGRGLCARRGCHQPRANWITRGGYRSPFCEEHSAHARITPADVQPRRTRRRDPSAENMPRASSGAQRLVYDAKQQRMVLVER